MTVEGVPSSPQDDAKQAGQGRERSKEVEEQRREALKGRVRKYVLHALGEPRDLLKIQVRPLWEGNYRVNVLTGDDPTRARIPHSYFVVTDGGGNVLGSTPGITRQY